MSSSPTKPLSGGTRKSFQASPMGQSLRKSIASEMSGLEVSFKSSVKSLERLGSTGVGEELGISIMSHNSGECEMTVEAESSS